MAQIKELLFFTYELQWVNKSPRRSSSTAVFLEPMEPMEPMWMEACSFSNYSFHSCAEVVSILPSWGGGNVQGGYSWEVLKSHWPYLTVGRLGNT